jgi:hypothetical protein
MPNGLDIISRAFRKIGVNQLGEALEGEMAVDALQDLNSLIQEWRGSGILFPDYAVTLNGQVTFSNADIRALVLNLAVELSAEYGDLPPVVAVQAAESKAQLMHRYFAPGKIDFSELPGTCSDIGFYNA